MRCLATQTNVSSHANQQIYSWAECAWILDISNPIAFNVSLAFTKNVYKWIHAKMPALKKCECMLCKGKRRGTSSSVCSFLLQDKMQRYGFLQPAFHKHLYYSKKMSVLQNYVLSFQTVLLSPNVINYCMEYVHNYRVKSWNRIVVYTHLFLRCFPLHEKSSAICPSPAFNAGWKLETAELLAWRGWRRQLFLGSLGSCSRLRCGKTSRSRSKWKPPLFPSHTPNITTNGEWWDLKKDEEE